MFPYYKLDENAVRERLATVTGRDVQASLSKSDARLSDLIALLSPAAAERLDALRERATRERFCRFGKTVNLYTPLYVGNTCVNACRYCGFRHDNKTERRRLTIEEALQDARVIKSYGIDAILVLCGEDPRYFSVEYLETLIRRLKDLFSYVAIEIYPMDEERYRRLYAAGAHGLTMYQETYVKANYAKFHPSGPKKDYEKRLEALEAGARAGFHNLGIAALFGLYDWRIEATFMAAHAFWLKKTYWRAGVQFSFPRINAAEGGFDPPYPVNETELEQMMLAFRIVFPESDIFISTRESRETRNRLAVSCANRVSAASRVHPGAYSASVKDLAQFTLKDRRSAPDVIQDLRTLGLEPVFKDWDPCLGLSA